eukprot:8174136-Heterocapsa_arctica.AAC.1
MVVVRRPGSPGHRRRRQVLRVRGGHPRGLLGRAVPAHEPDPAARAHHPAHHRALAPELREGQQMILFVGDYLGRVCSTIKGQFPRVGPPPHHREHPPQAGRVACA